MYKSNRIILRDKYSKILIEISDIIDTLSIRNQRGFIIEHGYELINNVLQMERNYNDTSEAIKIIGSNKWKTLKKLWNRLREIEHEDSMIINVKRGHNGR